MRPARLPVSLALTALFFLSTPTVQAAEPPPAEAFGSTPKISDVELSPNGRLLAWNQSNDQQSMAVIFDLDARVERRVVPVPDRMKLRSLTWADDETLLVNVSSFQTYGRRDTADHYEIFRTYSVDLNGGPARLLLMGGGARSLVTGASLLAWRTPKPKTVVMSTFDFEPTRVKQQTGTRLTVDRRDDGWISQVFEVDTRTGRGQPLAMGTPFTHDWVIDREGTPIARSEWNPASALFTVHVRTGQATWKEIFRQKDQGTRTLYGLTRDGTALMMSGVDTAGRENLWLLPLDGSEGRPLLEEQPDDISHVVYDRITGVPVSAFFGGLKQRQQWLDKEAEQRFQRVARAFKGRNVAVYGRSEDGQRVLAMVDSPSHPPVYYFVDFAKGTADIVGEAYPALIDATLGEVRAIHYPARDGASVPAYLTLPPGSDGKNLPLVVLPHGGPESRDCYAFDWWAQFLAVRGYAVLQPQFRGSTGFGAAWRQAGYRQWGGLMQDDVTDGVEAMVREGIADRERICIVGGSYGGYAALAGVAFTPDLYRCAVSVNGVADLPRMLAFEKAHYGAESNTLAYWREHIGSPLDPAVIAKSPMRAAAQIRAPVMLMHADEDTVVPPSQSRDMHQALVKLRKDSTYVKLAGEDHYLSKSATRIQMLKELEKFLAKHLGATPPGE